MTDIVINTLVDVSALETGTKQSELVEKYAKLGVKAVEIRREYIKDFNTELNEIYKMAQKYGVEVFYSVPDEVFVNGQVNPKLKSYLEEGNKLGLFAIKFNTGDYSDFKGDLEKELQFLNDSKIQVNIENDQTEVSGHIKPIKTFLEAAAANNVDIKYVYDLGNWRYVKEDEFEAIKQLGQYVRYIHLKDITYADGEPQVVPLSDGEIDWHKVLDELPKGLPTALEYPVKDTEELQKGIKLVTDYVK